MLSSLSTMPSNLPNPNPHSAYPVQGGYDTPRQSFDDLKALDPSNAPSDLLIRKGDGGTANFTMAQLMAPNQQRAQARQQQLPTTLIPTSNLPMPPTPTASNPRLVQDMTPFNSCDVSDPAPMSVPPGVSVGAPSQILKGPNLPPGIPVRRRRSSAARETARSIALAKKSQSIVTNLEATQNPNPNR